jgi:hypothetical protein
MDQTFRNGCGLCLIARIDGKRCLQKRTAVYCTVVTRNCLQDIDCATLRLARNMHACSGWHVFFGWRPLHDVSETAVMHPTNCWCEEGVTSQCAYSLLQMSCRYIAVTHPAAPLRPAVSLLWLLQWVLRAAVLLRELPLPSMFLWCMCAGSGAGQHEGGCGQGVRVPPGHRRLRELLPRLQGGGAGHDCCPQRTRSTCIVPSQSQELM